MVSRHAEPLRVWLPQCLQITNCKEEKNKTNKEIHLRWGSIQFFGDTASLRGVERVKILAQISINHTLEHKMHQFQAMSTADRSNLKMKITGYDFSLDQKIRLQRGEKNNKLLK